MGGAPRRRCPALYAGGTRGVKPAPCGVVAPGRGIYFGAPMDPKPLLIASDIHLGAVPAATERAFRAFLRHAAEVSSGLLINGDLFDFWFEYRTVIPREHYRVLAALAEVVEGGLPVWFVGGNHDAWGGSFLEEVVGMKLVEGPVEMELAGRRALVAHGDGVGSGDLGYRAMKWMIRHPVTVAAFRSLHPDWGARVANRVSTTDEKAAGMDATLSRALHIRRWAEAQLLARPELQLVVAGHSHHPEVVEVAPGRYYANAGDWIRSFTYLSLAPGGAAPALLRWE